MGQPSVLNQLLAFFLTEWISLPHKKYDNGSGLILEEIKTRGNFKILWSTIIEVDNIKVEKVLRLQWKEDKYNLN